MQKSGLIQKMQVSLDEDNAIYHLPIGDDIIKMNDLIGSQITLNFTGEIFCSNCGIKTKKSYSQGFCYPCCQSLAKCDLCIMKPETCHHHLGTCREPIWGLENCFSEHIIYLANSSGLKVGITRKSNVPSRWIDQGAISAIPILSVDTRLKSGIIEDSLKEFVADKTNWRKMLKNEIEEIDLIAKKQELLAKIPEKIAEIGANVLPDEIYNINYPVLEYPQKVVSFNFDKTPQISGILKGIKGQYLILDNGVLNIRKFGSYNLQIEY
jgi:hypothetical protein